ncbi:hypothetical protein ACHHYP_16373 [Achlya hypogyna]|uniref:Reverse transcriptase domain-containing protein n=1 Tax=Achlya hypogyna TaxID=1202772 RepID=A0A1V9Y8S0_ACHHY|nr:hypothetical protein ACHHYP_16373 [Achlya hypogyna]
MPGFSALHHVVELDVPGRYLVASTTWGTTPVYFHNVYGPVDRQERAQFYSALPRGFEPAAIHLVGGDLNLPLDESLEASHHRPDLARAQMACVEWLPALRVVDAWRLHHPSERVMSGPTGANRIDYLLIDSEVVSQLYQDATYTKNRYGGDHLVHSVTLSASPCTSSRGYWRLPCELLADPAIQAAVTAAEQLLAKMTSRTSTTPPPNIGAMLYGGLQRIKARLQECHRRYIVDTKAILHDHRMRRPTRLPVDWTRHSTAELRQYTMDVHFDLHANTNEQGSRHFFRRPQGSKIPITKAIVDAGAATDAPTAVLQSLTQRLSDVDREQLDAPLTSLELRSVITIMDSSNAVTLLLKAGDRGDPSNFRPIALMPVEVKPGAWPTLPELVHRSQAGFIPGHRLHDLVVFVQSRQLYCTMEDHGHYATFLDFSKAYDMDDQGFLMDTLRELNIGPVFFSWVALLVHLIFNGDLGPTIRPTRGVKQGATRGDATRTPTPRHPPPGGDTATCIFFADDSTLLSFDLPSAVELLEVVHEFCAVSGARLNPSRPKGG